MKWVISVILLIFAFALFPLAIVYRRNYKNKTPQNLRGFYSIDWLFALTLVLSVVVAIAAIVIMITL